MSEVFFRIASEFLANNMTGPGGFQFETKYLHKLSLEVYMN